MTTEKTIARGWLVPAGLATAVLALTSGLLLGRGMAVEDRVEDDVSLGFLRDMKVHHAQAVRMSSVLHARSEDPDLQMLALDILTAQQGEIGIMTGWLQQWGHSQAGDDPSMHWMPGHAGHMPGIARPEDLHRLSSAPVVEMEESFLRLMIAHHRGAVPMAEYAEDTAGSEDVAELAGSMAAAQAGEIELMQMLLEERGWEREPEEGHGVHG